MTTSQEQTNARAAKVTFTEDQIVVFLLDGRMLAVPLAWFPRLMNASSAQREEFELLGDGAGIHWPDLDEDVSVAGLLRGEPSVEVRPRRSA